MRALIFILAGALLWSCENSTDIGLGLQDEDDLLNSTLIDTFEIVTTSVLENTRIETNNTNTLLVGAYSDAKTGDIKAQAFVQLLYADESNYTYSTNPVCDSAILRLQYTVGTTSDEPIPHIYGDSLVVQNIEVFKLTEAFDSATSYLSIDELTFNATALGITDNLIPAPLTNEVTITLDANYGTELLVAANGMTNDEFTASIYGITLAPQDGSVGSVMGFDLTNNNTVLEVYYHDDDNASASTNFDLSSSSRSFNKITPDYTGTSLSGLVSAGDSVTSQDMGNEYYMQAGSGLNVKMRIPGLKKYLQNNSNFTVNRASIVIPTIPAASSGILDEPSLAVLLFETDNTNLILEDENGDVRKIGFDFSTQFFDFLYDSDDEDYELVLTDWVQRMSVGETEYTDLLMAPTINLTRVSRSYFYDWASTVDSSANPQFLLYVTQQ